jgi:hypothetical protein
MSSVHALEDDGMRVAPLVELSPEQRPEMERLARLRRTRTITEGRVRKVVEMTLHRKRARAALHNRLSA